MNGLLSCHVPCLKLEFSSSIQSLGAAVQVSWLECQAPITAIGCQDAGMWCSLPGLHPFSGQWHSSMTCDCVIMVLVMYPYCLYFVVPGVATDNKRALTHSPLFIRAGWLISPDNLRLCERPKDLCKYRPGQRIRHSHIITFHKIVRIEIIMRHVTHLIVTA